MNHTPLCRLRKKILIIYFRGRPGRKPCVVPEQGLRSPVSRLRRVRLCRRPQGCEVPELFQGILLPMQRQLAPRQDLRPVRPEPRPQEHRYRGRRAARRHLSRGLRLPVRTERRWARRSGHQAVPYVPRAYREGRRLRADDVQEVQARVLLVLPGIPRRKW